MEAGKLSADDLNALIAHAHRRIDQLNRELAEQRVREQIHIDTALEQQKLEDQKALEKAVNTTLQHVKEEARLEQEQKVRKSESGSGFAEFPLPSRIYSFHGTHTHTHTEHTSETSQCFSVLFLLLLKSLLWPPNNRSFFTSP